MPDRVDDLVAIIQALTKVAEEGMSRSLDGHWDIHRWASLTLTDQQFLMWKAATRQYDGQAGDSGVNSSQCHRDIDQLLAEIKRLRDMLTLCENHCSDGFVAEQARTVLAHRIELIDGEAGG